MEAIVVLLVSFDISMSTTYCAIKQAASLAAINNLGRYVVGGRFLSCGRPRRASNAYPKGRSLLDFFTRFRRLHVYGDVCPVQLEQLCTAISRAQNFKGMSISAELAKLKNIVFVFTEVFGRLKWFMSCGRVTVCALSSRWCRRSAASFLLA